MASKWMITGTYFEACNCDVVCPCLFTSKPTIPNDCRVFDAWHIDKGQMGRTDLSGLNVAMTIDSPGHMLEVPWTVALYIDKRADKKQNDALTRIFGGKVGGHPALLANHVGKVNGISTVPIKFVTEGKRRHVTIPKIANVEVTAIPGQAGGAVVLANQPLAVSPNEAGVVAHATRFRYTDYGETWEFSETSGLFAAFTYSGP